MSEDGLALTGKNQILKGYDGTGGAALTGESIFTVADSLDIDLVDGEAWYQIPVWFGPNHEDPGAHFTTLRKNVNDDSDLWTISRGVGGLGANNSHSLEPINAALSAAARTNGNDLNGVQVIGYGFYADNGATVASFEALGATYNFVQDSWTQEVIPSGNGVVGETLSLEFPGLPGDADVYIYWFADEEYLNVDDASFVVPAELVGSEILAFVEFERDGFQSIEAGPFEFAVVAEAEVDPFEVSEVTIDGLAKVGETLTANVTWTATPDVVTYQWLADGVAIDGATDETLVLSDAQIGQKISVLVIGVKDGFGEVEGLSDETAAVVAATVVEDEEEEPAGSLPGDDLAATGASIIAPIAAVTALLLLGAGAFVIRRRIA